jgi:hypothetical protein
MVDFWYIGTHVKLVLTMGIHRSFSDEGKNILFASKQQKKHFSQKVYEQIIFGRPGPAGGGRAVKNSPKINKLPLNNKKWKKSSFYEEKTLVGCRLVSINCLACPKGVKYIQISNKQAV